MICVRTSTSRWMALKRLVSTVMIPHSPVAAVGSVTAPNSASQAPKKRAKVISVGCCAAAASGSAASSNSTHR
jgi:hypothetical protein